MSAPTKVQLTGGVFQDSEGNPLALGYLLMKLAQDGNISGVGNIASGIEITIKLDSNGSVVSSPAQAVWGVDQMLPINNYYRVTGYTAAGQPAWGPNNQQVTGNGGTFDVGTWVPNQVISWTPPLQNTVLLTNSVLNSDQTRLNVEDTATVTWASTASGVLKATAVVPASIDVKTNSVDNSSQTVLNFEDTSSVTWANPSGGIVKATVINALSALNLITNRTGYINVVGSGSTTLIGVSGVSVTGTVTFANATSTEPYYIIYTSSAGAGSFAGSNIGLVYVARGTLVAYQARVLIPSTANIRQWVALTASTSINANAMASDTPAVNLVGFRYSTAAGDTNWMAVTTNGVTQTTTSTGIAADTAGHSFRITFDGTNYNFWIDGVLKVQQSTNLPVASALMSPTVQCDNIGLANAKAIEISYAYVDLIQ